jgi:hypothetical protein
VALKEMEDIRENADFHEPKLTNEIFQERLRMKSCMETLSLYEARINFKEETEPGYSVCILDIKLDNVCKACVF